ncbi:MAG: methyl-accepting chemotaxis protein [Clostridia bacterium]|nr:methyl-accepting chemotaxis protein [Clostridia bacterium]
MQKTRERFSFLNSNSSQEKESFKKFVHSLKFNSIGVKLTLSFLVMIVPIILLGAISYSKSKAIMKASTVESCISTVKQTEKYLGLLFSNVSNTSKQLATNNTLLGMYSSAHTDYNSVEFDTQKVQVGKQINAYLSTNENIAGILIAFKPGASIFNHGTYAGSNEDLSVENIKKGQWFRSFEDKKKTSGWVGLHQELDKLGDREDASTKYAERLQSGAYISYVSNVAIQSVERQNALIIMDLKLEPIYELLQNINFGRGSEIHMVMPDGRDIGFVIDPKTNKPQKASAEISNAPFYKEILRSQEKQGSNTISYNGKTNLMVYSKIGDTGIALISLIPQSNLLLAAKEIAGITWILVILGIIAALGMGLFAALDIGLVINKAVSVTNCAAHGDLTVTVECKRKDEFGILMSSIGEMVNNMKKLIGNASDISKKVEESTQTMTTFTQEASEATQEIAKAIQEIASGASSQAEDVEEGVQKMEHLAIKIANVSEKTKDIEVLSGDTMKLTKSALDSIRILNSKSNENSQIVKTILEDINTLGERSKFINNIVKVINGIADQTNLLALNAAIEAARAGEAGKGFAVVADEVRHLAEQSREATKEIGQIVSEIQRQTTDTVEKAKVTEEVLTSQNQAVASTLGVFENIERVMNSMVLCVGHIMSSIEDMEKAKVETMSTMENISAVSEETAASVEEVTASTQQQQASIDEMAVFAEKLNEAAKELTEIINRFKV